MRRPDYNESWPESWRLSHLYDELEVWGSRRDLGYCNQYQIRHEWSLRTVQELVPAGGSILDVAAASGNFTLPLAEKGYRVTWNDLRADLAQYVKLKYEFGNVEFSPGNIFELAAGWVDRFDAVLATEVIEHLAHPDEFLVCLATMVKPGGRIFLTTPNGRYFRNNLPRFSDCPDPSVFESVQFKPNADGHIFLLDRDECRALARKAGLEPEGVALLTNPLTTGHVKLGKILPYVPTRMVWAVEERTAKLPGVLGEKINSQMVACLRKPI